MSRWEAVKQLAGAVGTLVGIVIVAAGLMTAGADAEHKAMTVVQG